MVSDFPSNSHIRKETAGQPEPKKIEAVVTGEVIRRKKPLGKRFAETFVGGDVRSVGGYVLFDVMLPAAKDMFADAVSQGIERLIFGEVRSSGRRVGSRTVTPVSYQSYNRGGYSPPQAGGLTREPRDVGRRGRSSHSFDEIILETRAEAQEVIDLLFEIVNKYNRATVSDLYDLVGITGNYTDEKFGWDSLEGSDIVRTRSGGYLLALPKPEPLQ